MGGNLSRHQIDCQRIKPKTARETHEKHPVAVKNVRIIDGRTYHAVDGSSYILPRDDIEIDRMHEEHFVTKELLGCNVMSEALKCLHFQGGLSVLDVCCGPATWLCETSLEYPTCQFSGVDMCNVWPQVIRPVNLNFTEANILRGLPYADTSFDFVQIRFVGLAFKTDEWPFIMSEIRRVLKDGGCFQCVELDMRITTEDSGARNWGAKFEQFCLSQGLDLAAGAKIGMMLGDAGMPILQSEYREISIGWGGPLGEAYGNLYKSTLLAIAPFFRPFLSITQKEYEEYLHEACLGLAQSKGFMGLYAFLAQKPLDD
ncbi:S-adenosyl-L-methionine-dependent methyltransferase [Radiomyces spectabilis]|uniref:S-adenosyl-L-methionine-dependent methyltransferase n=1 Tax=Radiomyces spectabilis TaxID=64574 RepID=UPI002220C251|nr:S-adenosyl-L-methionine-dependent methyltransferase [Radiomyces spectabilis]KAI8384972.1 S-adenosyl-L-methionine-dependent methyltransferase [Radiomyces spectabilis]